MTTDPEFIDHLPPTAHSYRKHEHLLAWAEKLRANPGRWAKYPYPIKNPRNHVYHINNGDLKTFRPTGTFEAAYAEKQIYVRYVGEGEA